MKRAEPKSLKLQYTYIAFGGSGHVSLRNLPPNAAKRRIQRSVPSMGESKCSVNGGVEAFRQWENRSVPSMGESKRSANGGIEAFRQWGNPGAKRSNRVCGGWKGSCASCDLHSSPEVHILRNDARATQLGVEHEDGPERPEERGEGWEHLDEMAEEDIRTVDGRQEAEHAQAAQSEAHSQCGLH